MTSPLARVALFKELPEPGLQMLAERGRPKQFSSGAVIMRQGDASDALHVITRGAFGSSATRLATYRSFWPSSAWAMSSVRWDFSTMHRGRRR